METITTLLAFLTWSGACQAFPQTGPAQAWPGWGGIKHMFVFGDSYSQTGFNLEGTQPAPSNPLGNPTYPGGPNWVDFLTTTYNDSLVLTYNLASGGATVDSNLVRPYAETVLSIKDQVEDSYLTKYGDADFWDPLSTLFAFWIGINDVGNAHGWPNNTSGEVFDLIFSQYSTLVEKVVGTGARNFVFLNVPPVQRSPLTTQQAIANPTVVSREEAAVKNWNERIDALASNIQTKHQGITAMVFDAYSVFSEVLSNPKAHAQTAGYTKLVGYCTSYEKYASPPKLDERMQTDWNNSGTPDKDTFTPSCGAPVNQYFWLNSLHPTYPMHDAAAYELAKVLSREVPATSKVARRRRGNAAV
ncbi:hypothetical protein LTS18_012705 [Coniosporium uncinatum]|uniref:Uncharacterized protein n=1 Tax=Coniosporium uncinatum TaxID=93489 RepID=A0ACC3D9A0_9PEZI|nr:hypothetical protein LTS18_012705 [Coniosporium uncinatum]